MNRCLACDKEAPDLAYRNAGVDIYFCYTDECREEAWEILKVGMAAAPIYATSEWMARRKKYKGLVYEANKRYIICRHGYKVLEGREKVCDQEPEQHLPGLPRFQTIIRDRFYTKPLEFPQPANPHAPELPKHPIGRCNDPNCGE